MRESRTSGSVRGLGRESLVYSTVEMKEIVKYCVDKGVLWDFKDEKYHTRIIISHGVRVIGEAAFADCMSL